MQQGVGVLRIDLERHIELFRRLAVETQGFGAFLFARLAVEGEPAAVRGAAMFRQSLENRLKLFRRLGKEPVDLS